MSDALTCEVAMAMYEQHQKLYTRPLPPWMSLLQWQRDIWLDRARAAFSAHETKEG